MNQDIIVQISKDLNITEKQVRVVLEMLSLGNTIPFIARYRKEKTGALDEEQIRSINTVYEYQVNLLKRKEDVIRLIDEKGLLNDELKNSILACQKLVDVEDIYNIKYYLEDKALKREVRDKAAQVKVDTVLENTTAFSVDKDDLDIKQIFVKISVDDPKSGIKRDVDFAVRLETDFVYVDKRDL